jgi:Leucine-rich repeat (LRR) protein
VQGTVDPDLFDTFIIYQEGDRQLPTDDRPTLLNLATKLNGATWQDNWIDPAKPNSWLPDRDLTEWEGVTTDETGKRVVALEFSTKAVGDLPEEIGDLLYLEKLKLDNTYVGGTFPPQIANLKKLREISFNAREFDGVIPEFGALTDLRKLTISGSFKGTPGAHMDAIGYMENLEDFTLQNGNFGASMPASWGNLKKLRTFYLSGLEGMSNVDAIGGMTALRELTISDVMGLTAPLPESFGNLTDLTRLTLNKTKLSGLPQSLGNLTKLNYLYVYDTDVAEIPTSVEDLKALRTLILNGNKLTALPAALSGMTSLTRLDIIGHQDLEGELPLNIGNLTSLTTLYIENNPKLGGAIPESITNLQGLTTLALARNAFTEIPRTLGRMTRLTMIDIRGNDFQCTIPESIGDLVNLRSLHIERTTKDPYKGVYGSIPESLGNIATLETINLENNQLSGIIPMTFEGLTKLKQLHLQNNELTGPLPGFFAAFPDLTVIRLENNGLSGSLPGDFRDLQWIGTLNLYNNNFEGSIPEGFQGRGVSYTGTGALFNIEMNKLTGTIPETFLIRATAAPGVFHFRQQKQGFGFEN